MDIQPEEVSAASKNFFWFILQIVILVLCLTYIEYIYYTNIRPDKRVKEYFVQTPCRIDAKKLSIDDGIIQRYRADFLVSFMAKKPVQTWVSGNGLSKHFGSNRAAKEAILNQFQVGQTYHCWQNPQNLNEVALVLRHNWSSTFPLFIPSMIAILMLYYILKEIFQFFDYVRDKNQEAKQMRNPDERDHTK